MSASKVDPARGRHVLVTGATGFLGKVVLCELLRQAEDCGIARVTLLVRSRRDRSAHERIFDGAMGLACFDGLRARAEATVQVLEADLAAPDCGIGEAMRAELAKDVTHVIHCAATVDFDRPMAEAATANIDASLNLLALCRTFKKLESMVVTSTAYVTPWTPGPIAEELVKLPRPASALYADIRAGKDERALLAELGHANTYTFTKCIGEHLLCEQRGQVPLCIVRPSIISAAWQRPFPGWIDSRAAFAGFVVTIGAGVLRVIDADPNVRLDLVPVDVVTAALLRQAFGRPRAKAAVVPIVHAVAGARHGAPIGDTSNAIVRFFRRRPIGRRAALHYVGPRGWRFEAAERLHQRTPARLLTAAFRLRGDAKGASKVQKAAATVRTINEVFPYFTHHTFHFESSHSLPREFSVPAYIERVCAGAFTHLMHRNGRQVPFAGRAHRSGRSDAVWAVTRAEGGLGRRALALRTRLEARLAFASVTVDEPSFLRAREQLVSERAGDKVAWLPVGPGRWARPLCELLALSRPDLGIALGDVVAAGAGKLGPLDVDGFDFAGEAGPSSAALEEIHRRFGVTTVVPVAVSVHGHAASPTSLARRASSSLRAGAEDASAAPAARAHLQAAAPIVLSPEHSGPQAARAMRAALGRTYVPTEDDLAAFLHLHPRVGLDVPRLRDALERRGGQVLPGLPRRQASLVDVVAERRARRLWLRFFAPDLLARFGSALPLRATFVQQVDAPAMPRNRPDRRLSRLLDALAQPMAADFAATARAVGRMLAPGGRATARALLTEAHAQDEQTAVTALVALCDAGVLQREDDHGLGSHTVVFRRLCDDADLQRVLDGCRLTPHGERKSRASKGRRPAFASGSALLH